MLHVAVLVGESVKTWIHWDDKGTAAGGAEVEGGGLPPPAWAVAREGTPEGRPPVSHHEYIVPLTVPLPIPAISPPWQEHMVEGESSPILDIGAALENGRISMTTGEKAETENTMTYVVMKQFGIAMTVFPFVELVSAQGTPSPLVKPGGSAPGGQVRGSARFQIDVN